MASSSPVSSASSDLPSQDEIRQIAWKYTGYKRFSRFVGFHRNFSIARQFRTLNARVILAMQDEITELEEELDNLDSELSTKSASNIHNGSFRLETHRPRHALVWDLQKRLKNYNEYICSYTQVGNRPEASKVDVQSVKAWFARYQNGIDDAEKGYLDTGEDLVYVLPKSDRPWLHSKFSKIAYKLCVRQPTDTSAFDPDTLFLQEEERTSVILTRSMLLIGLVMLITPLWILHVVHGPTQQLSVITSFIIFFLALVAFASGARPFESLAATAAYSAVLMVFLQISRAT